MKLTMMQCKNAVPQERAYKLSDGRGLHLLVQPNGSKLWRWVYRFAGKQMTMSLGKFPEVSLAAVRDKVALGRAQVKIDVDPQGTKRKAAAGALTLRGAAEEWFSNWKVGKDAAHVSRVWNRIERDALDALGDRLLDKIKAPAIVEVIRAVEARGAIDVSKRLKQTIGQIFMYAIAAGHCENNPTMAVGAALKPKPKTVHMASLAATELPVFVRKLAAYDGDDQTRLAIKLVLHTWTRTKEIRFARWEEIEDIDGAAPLWRIPAGRMKMGREHLVPLTASAVAVLREIGPKRSGLMFPAHTRSQVMSENTMIYALYRMGYHSRLTVHGLRGTASTMANEHGWNFDWVERQLAHVEENKIRGAYNSAEYLSGRRKMMEWWEGIINAAAEPHDEFAALMFEG